MQKKNPFADTYETLILCHLCSSRILMSNPIQAIEPGNGISYIAGRKLYIDNLLRIYFGNIGQSLKYIGFKFSFQFFHRCYGNFLANSIYSPGSLVPLFKILPTEIYSPICKCIQGLLLQLAYYNRNLQLIAKTFETA